MFVVDLTLPRHSRRGLFIADSPLTVTGAIPATAIKPRLLAVATRAAFSHSHSFSLTVAIGEARLSRFSSKAVTACKTTIDRKLNSYYVLSLYIQNRFFRWGKAKRNPARTMM